MLTAAIEKQIKTAIWAYSGTVTEERRNDEFFTEERRILKRPDGQVPATGRRLTDPGARAASGPAAGGSSWAELGA